MSIEKSRKNLNTKLSKKLYQEAARLIGLSIDEKDSAKRAEYRKKVLQLLKESAALGYSTAQYEMALQYDEYGLFGQNDAKAVHWYKIACKNGHIEANNNLAAFYTLGIVVRKNLKKAKDLTLIAATNGSTSAQYNMGIMLESSDLDDSVKWFTMALAGGENSAALKLAHIYAHDRNLKNKKTAQKYLKMVGDLIEDEMEEMERLKKYLTKSKR